MSSLDFPASPTVGQIFQGWRWDSTKWASNATAIGYPELPPEVQQVPIAVPFGGKPAASAVVNIPVAMALTVAAGLSGSVAYAQTAASADATFTVSKVSGGTVTTLGTCVFHAGSAPTFSGAGGSLAAGDVLRVTAPGTQDATLADCAITVLAMRV